MTDLAELPDERPVYIDGYGPTTLGVIRATEQSPALDDQWEKDLQILERIVTEHLCEGPWPGDTA